MIQRVEPPWQVSKLASIVNHMVITRNIYQQLDPKSSAYGTDTNTDKGKKSQAFYENITNTKRH